MENYEQKYKEALDRCKRKYEFAKNEGANGTMVWMEEIFPELKESEDERIRKEVINVLKLNIKGAESQMQASRGVNRTFEVYACNKVITWLEKQGEKIDAIENFDTEFEKQVSCLIASSINKEHEYNEGFVKWAANALLNYAKHELEKQGEQKDPCETCDHAMLNCINFPCKDKQNKQKPADKFEPKFKVGDWVVYNRNDSSREIIQVYDIRDGRYYFTDNVHFSWSIKECDEKAHLWTIQDAKDGDVLAFNDGHGNDCIELIKSVTDTKKDKKIEFWFCLTNNSCCEVFDGIVPYTNMTSRKKAVPATKEQRDQLEKAMTDAGYTFDFEKKELKKIEQKPDDEVGNYDHKKVLQTIINEQKPAWSEEDGNLLSRLIGVLDGTNKEDYHEDWEETFLPWLKSIKEAMKGE